MLSIIIQEHNESKAFVRKMLEQTGQLSMDKELIFVTSKPYQQFYDEYLKGYTYRFPVSVIGNIQSPGAGRNEGARMAEGEDLLFLDCHVCFTPSTVERILNTLEKNPLDFIGGGLTHVLFPDCSFTGGVGYGAVFRFRMDGQPWEWTWLGKERDEPYPVPFICACQIACKKKTMNHLLSYGGFLTPEVGVGMEEELFMRAWRLGHRAIVDPKAIFGHMFKCHPKTPCWDEHSRKGWIYPRIAGIYVNVFNEHLCRQIKAVIRKHWGNAWEQNISKAKWQYGWLREQLRPYRDRIREEWFLRTR